MSCDGHTWNVGICGYEDAGRTTDPSYAVAIDTSACSCADPGYIVRPCIDTYTTNDNWGGVLWQSPANDWGDQPGGLNLTGAAALEFWVRGAAGGEKVNFVVGAIGKDKPYHDTAK